MTVLLITPDYASHYLPLVPIGHAFEATGDDVVVATGTNLRERVIRDGFKHVELRLGESGNSGLIDATVSPGSELAANIEASGQGMIQMLTFQAQRRLRDLFWQPDVVLDQLASINAARRPDTIISVSLAYNVTAALLALNLRFVTFVTGHPSEFPAEGELYGYPHFSPARFAASKDEFKKLSQLCRFVQGEFTQAFNRFIHKHRPEAPTIPNGLAGGSSDLVIFNYPVELGTARERRLPACATFVGSCVRREHLDTQLQYWIDRKESNLMTLYVSLGSFFSIRTDVLARIVEALRREPVRVLLAHGVSDPARLGSVPRHWLVRRYFPQAAVLPHCDLIICHGGHNSVTEALTFGVPLLVGPFSSDQFGSAADVEKFGLGAVFDPNTSSEREIRDLLHIARLAKPMVATIGERLREVPGAERVHASCQAARIKSQEGSA